MGGYAIGNDRGIGVMDFPHRKQLALYAKRDCVIYPLAYFKSREAAEEAEELLALLVKGTLVTETGP